MARFQFAADDSQELKDKYRLAPDIISQIEQVMDSEGGMIDHFRKMPTAKQKRRAIEQLRNSVAKLTEQLKTIDPSTEEYLHFCCVGYGKEPALKELELLGISLAKVSLPKDNKKKKETHFSIENIVVSVARLLIQNNVILSKDNQKIVGNNKQFQRIIRIVFSTMNIKASPRVVIERCCNDIKGYMVLGDEYDADWEPDADT